MLITSFTTMMAFVATAFSPLVEVVPSFGEKQTVYPQVTLTALSPTALSNGSQVQSFGIYSALLILTDYLLVITWFPSCVVIYHDRFESRPNCCCACCGCFHKSDGSCNCGQVSELGCGPTVLNTTSSGRRTFDCIFKYKQPWNLQAAAAETSDATETGAVPRKMEVFFGSAFVCSNGSLTALSS